jgi:L-methionine (R)-S-oxide reductase
MWSIGSKYESDDYYQNLNQELLTMIDHQQHLVANLSNTSSWIYHSFPNLNWCGFYLWNEVEQNLILGPFQGKPACFYIPKGRGVCGSSFELGKSIRVSDVSTFEDHITCDTNSLSELVIPLIKNGQKYGVLDLDSPHKGRFTQRDEDGLTFVMNSLSEKLF